MPCVNHPAVSDGLSPCTACAKSFCIDCLVGRKSGWFCSSCDTEAAPKPVPAADVPTVLASPPPAPVALPGLTRPAARPKSGCVNHPEVLDGLNTCALCAEKYCPDCLVELKGRRYCAACKVEAVKDIQSGVSSSGLQIAGIGARFAALFVDGMVTNFIMMPLFLVLGGVMSAVQPGKDSAAVPLLVLGFYALVIGGVFCYHGFMLQIKGQTLGKMALKIKVVNPDGSKISPGQAWIRTLVWTLLGGCLIDYIPAFFNEEKLAIHDMAAKTRVVKVG